PCACLSCDLPGHYTQVCRSREGRELAVSACVGIDDPLDIEQRRFALQLGRSLGEVIEGREDVLANRRALRLGVDHDRVETVPGRLPCVLAYDGVHCAYLDGPQSRLGTQVPPDVGVVDKTIGALERLDVGDVLAVVGERGR